MPAMTVKHRQAHRIDRGRRRVPRVELPERVESCIVITPDGAVATYQLSPLDKWKREALYRVADEVAEHLQETGVRR